MEHFRRVEGGAEHALRGKLCGAKPSQRIIPPRQTAWQRSVITGVEKGSL
jgi:hypothetical protein